MHTKKLAETYNRIIYKVWSYIDPIPTIFDHTITSVLDLGCGTGNPMKLIKSRHRINYTEGVDVFDSYLNIHRNTDLYNKLVKKDITKINYKPKSFDVVMAAQVIEHLSNAEGKNLIRKMEKIARKLVIISTPIGECFHPAVDGNVYQLHKSAYSPDDFTKLGYKVIRYGYKKILSEHDRSLISLSQNRFWRISIFATNAIMTPIYNLFPEKCDYTFIAYKNVDKNPK